MFAVMPKRDVIYDDMFYIGGRNGGASILFLPLLVSSHGKQSQKVSLSVIFRMGIAKGVDVRVSPPGFSLALVLKKKKCLR